MPSQRVSSAAYTLFVFFAVALICTSAAAQTKFKVLYNFKGGTDAAAPTAGVILDGSGSLYGTAGGGTSYGTVYELTPHADGEWTEAVLHRWNGYGENIFGGLAIDPRGNLYGATALGGTHNDGTVFELTRAAKWGAHVLYNFGSRPNDAGVPGAGLLRQPDGNLYGLARYPYELSFGTDGHWHERVLYRFTLGTPDGNGPVGTLVSDEAGNLYGATEFGGIYPPMCGSGGGGCGTVFELELEADGKWKEKVLHRFAQFKNDGELPMAGLVMDAAGNLYGATAQGGSVRNGGLCREGCGVVFKLSPGANGRWKETILYNFCHTKGCTDGAGGGALVFDKAGNLYGNSAGGLDLCPQGCGVVFELSPSTDGQWTHHVLHQFQESDGAYPNSGLTLDKGVNLYGTTFSGGSHEYGVVYEITP
jgi:uncharacterized repeat protein (TIGR03803 family)